LTFKQKYDKKTKSIIIASESLRITMPSANPIVRSGQVI